MDYTALYYKKLCEDLEKRIYSLLEGGFGGGPPEPPPKKRPYRPGDSRLDPRTRNKKRNTKVPPNTPGFPFGFDFGKPRDFSDYVEDKRRNNELNDAPKIDLPNTWNPGKDENYNSRRRILSASEKNLGSMGTSGTLGKYSQTYRF